MGKHEGKPRRYEPFEPKKDDKQDSDGGGGRREKEGDGKKK